MSFHGVLHSISIQKAPSCSCWVKVTWVSSHRRELIEVGWREGD